MDLATLIGLIVGLVLIVGSMAMGTGIGPFINRIVFINDSIVIILRH